MSAELDNTAKEMRALDELTATLEKSMRGGGTQQQQADLAKLRAESERLAKSETELTGKLYAARDTMAVSGVSVKNLAAEEARLSSESAAATAQLDRLTAEAQTLKAIADAKIQLGIDTDDKARQEIQKTKDAYELLKDSGTLSHEELARAAQLQEGKVRELEGSLKGVKPSIAEVASEIQGLVGGAGGLAFATREAMKFETAMAGVRKVADGTDEQYAKLSDELKKMGAELGISAAEMAELAATGGQLGIPIEKLSEFTAIASKMSVAFGLSAEEAGNAAATIANVFQIPIGEVENSATPSMSWATIPPRVKKTLSPRWRVSAVRRNSSDLPPTKPPRLPTPLSPWANRPKWRRPPSMPCCKNCKPHKAKAKVSKMRCNPSERPLTRWRPISPPIRSRR